VTRSSRDNAGTTFGTWHNNIIWDGKNVKNLRDFGQLSTLIPNMSGTDRRNGNLKIAFSTTNPHLLGGKNWWTWVTNKKVIGVNVDPPKWSFYNTGKLYFGHRRLKFLHTLQPLNCTFSRIWGTGRPQVGLCPIFLGSFCFTRLFNLPQDLRAPSADRHKTLPHDQYQRRFYNASPKIRGPTMKNFRGQKHVKFGPILHNFRLCSRLSQDIQNRRDMWPRTIPPAFSETSLVNFGPLSIK